MYKLFGLFPVDTFLGVVSSQHNASKAQLCFSSVLCFGFILSCLEPSFELLFCPHFQFPPMHVPTPVFSQLGSATILSPVVLALLLQCSSW